MVVARNKYYLRLGMITTYLGTYIVFYFLPSTLVVVDFVCISFPGIQNI